MEGTRRNQLYLQNLLLNLKPKIIFLQEIWLPYSDHKTLDKLHPEYSFKISTPDMFQHPEDLLVARGHVWHGVAVGWRSDMSACVEQLASTSDRVAGIKIPLQGKSLLLLSYYAPTAGHDEDFLDSKYVAYTSSWFSTLLLEIRSSSGLTITAPTSPRGEGSLLGRTFAPNLSYLSTCLQDHPFTIIMALLSHI